MLQRQRTAELDLRLPRPALWHQYWRRQEERRKQPLFRFVYRSKSDLGGVSHAACVPLRDFLSSGFNGFEVIVTAEAAVCTLYIHPTSLIDPKRAS